MIDKKLIGTRFNNNFNNYNINATVQKNIAKRLYNKLLEFEEFSTDIILEIGCGTGFLTKLLLQNFDINTIYINDLYENNYIKTDILDKKTIKCKYFIGDAEKINLPNNISSVVSSSTIQWFNDIEKFFNKISHILNNGGYFAFTTFGKSNFLEIKNILDIGLKYFSKHELEKILQKNFKILYAEEWIEKLWFNNTYDILKHIKNTGVNSIINYKWNKKRLLYFKNKYEELFKIEEKFSLTYNPIIFIVKK